VLGWAVAAGLLLGAIRWIGDGSRTGALAEWIARLSGAMVVWLIVGPVWSSLSALVAAGRPDRPTS
jgi:hypothetical protein